MKPVTRSLGRGTVMVVCLGMWSSALAQERATGAPSAVAALAFVNVNVIPMDIERVVAGQTVLVSGDRIIAVGPSRGVALPGDTTIIDGAGRYLIPGLVDAHAHLQTPDGLARPDFGDAPLYLAHGVTTVVNLRGTPTHLEWRRRVLAGEILGPTIYTTGEFVNEPRVNTPEEVQREIDAQVRAGYDLVKFHQVMNETGGFSTTTGLSLPAYLGMRDAARQARIPLVGHAPLNLGLEALLSSPGVLAHVGELTTLYFVRPRTVFWSSIVCALAVVALLPVLTIRQLRILTGWVLVTFVTLFVFGLLLGPGGALFDSTISRLLFTALIVLQGALTVPFVVSAGRLLRDPAIRLRTRVLAGVGTVSLAVLAVVSATVWLPLAWRTSDASIAALAARLRDAGVSVQSTLSVYDAVRTSADDMQRLVVGDPSFESLHPVVRERWRQMAGRWSPGGPADALIAPRHLAFAQRLIGALHRQGVMVTAGTDTMGFPLIVPGVSLHRELQLLVESGLRPYEAIRAATVNPAILLNKEKEFGTIAAGKRADLLLLDGDPLQRLTTLKRPIGVLVRGRWLSREELRQRLDARARDR